MTDLAGDRFIAHSTWKWIDAHAATSGQPVYRYLFSRARPGEQGAVQSAKIEYAMGNLMWSKVFAWTEDDRKVPAAMQSYSVNFIKTGDPNGSGWVKWPVGKAIGTSAAQRLRINVEQRAEAEPRARYEFLDRAFTRP